MPYKDKNDPRRKQVLLRYRDSILNNREHVKITDFPQSNFWKNVDKNGPLPAHTPELGTCWLWMGKLNPNGYGSIWIRPKMIRVHRASYAFFYEEPKKELEVCHKCDVRHCVRPDHLFLGTHVENMRDCIRKGRDKTLNGKWISDHPEVMRRGESHTASKLDNNKVKEIRRLHEIGIRCKEIGQKTGMHVNTIRAVVIRRTWKHVL